MSTTMVCWTCNQDYEWTPEVDRCPKCGGKTAPDEMVLTNCVAIYNAPKITTGKRWWQFWK